MSNTIYWHPRWAIQIALDDSQTSQKQLAQQLDWPPSKLSLILNGKQKLTVDELTEIARAQNRDISWYFNPPPPRPESTSPLSLDLGQVAIPRYVTLGDRLIRLSGGFGRSGLEVA